MTYLAVKTHFLAVLNRRDITSTLVDTFMGFGVQRIQSEVRLPPMEQVTELTSDGTAELTVPTDLQEIISIHVNDDNNGRTKLIKSDLQTILTKAAYQGQPKFYHIEEGIIYMGPFPPTDQPVFIHYYQNPTALSADGDTNWLTETHPLMLVYAALTYAADYYIDDRIKLFEDRYTQIRDNLVSMMQQDEVVNASIRPSFWDDV
jgi:hypothetical protein